jgi:hypothetical protein
MFVFICLSIQVATAGANTILIHNRAGATLVGNVTLVWQALDSNKQSQQSRLELGLFLSRIER